MRSRAPREFSRAEASRAALAAQGFGQRSRRTGPPTLRTVEQVLARTGVFQVDSVNVLARAHTMPLYSRSGPYDPSLLERAASGRDRRMVEYWAHVQALMPVTTWPLMRHRMDDYARAGGKWGQPIDAALAGRVLALVAERGPVTAKQLDAEFAPAGNRDHWGWNWSQARRVLDFLYVSGQVAIRGRTRSFEVVHDLTERVLPPSVLSAPVPERGDAERELVRMSVEHVGIGSLSCIADHYRMPKQVVRRCLAELVEDGAVVPALVQGWGTPLWAAAHLRVPRRVEGSTLLSPFDPLVWNRARAEALFDFRYRIEIYTPAARRVHGYYVLPFLHEGTLAARVDLKADRASGVLWVRSAFGEDGAPSSTVPALAAELRRLGAWAGVPQVQVEDRGPLAQDLAAEVARAG